MTTLEEHTAEIPAPSRWRTFADEVGPLLSEVGATRWWPTVSLFFVLAATATLTSSWGHYIGDNRFEQYWNPARRIVKTLTIWDGSRGLGRVREEFWPGTTVPLAILRGIGLTPTMVEHLFHASLIAMAGVGMVAIVRLFQPRIRVEHILAGLFVSFGAYSATFLLPSNLYFHYALAPWLFVVVFRGVHSERPWKWAAIFALLTFAPGNVDTPGLIYNCIPSAAVLLVVVLVERSVRLRNVIGWLARAFALSVIVNVAMLVKTAFGAAALGSRLGDTEAPEIAAYTSSWPESFRGLGNWLSYFPSGNTLTKPQGAAYFTNWVVVACTFVPPVVALVVLWRSRWRVRLLYAITMIISLIVLVGAFPVTDPSPVGGFILRSYKNIASLAAFRNTYKIGSGLAIGVGALFAYGVVLATRSLRQHGTAIRQIPVVLAFVVLAGISFPFWTGQLYHPAEQMGDLPAYWSQTFDYLAKIPEDGRSLVLPQISRTRYRWGWVGDDIFDALDARDHALVNGVADANPQSANVLEALAVVASDPSYTAGSLAPVMRRLGLTEIVLRNDLDWQALHRPRPSAYDALRVDPDFERIATFGRPGENTADADDKSELGDRDRSYAPVEIFRLRDRVGTLQTEASAAPLLVAGDGFGWSPLARAGLLANTRPVAPTAELDRAALGRELDAGSPVLITDTNRRRLRLVVNYEPDYSYVLAAGQDLDRPAQSTWPVEGSQSVAWFRDATSISLSGTPRSVNGSHPWDRPANAFDDDPASDWLMSRTDGFTDRVLRVDLRETKKISEARFVLPQGTTPGSGIRKGQLRFSSGDTVPVDLTGAAETVVDFPQQETSFIEFVPTDINSNAQSVGLGDLTFPGLDLREYVQIPDDVFRLAADDQALAAKVASAPTGYVFSRAERATTRSDPQPTFSDDDEELSLRRRFFMPAARDLDVSGFLHLRADTPDAIVDRLVGGTHGAYGSSRVDGDLQGYGGYAVDGDPGTAWRAPAETDTTLTLRFPLQTVSSVSLSSRYDETASHIDRYQVEVGGRSVGATMTPSDPGCDREARPANSCVRTGRLVLDEPVQADHLTVRIMAVSGRKADVGGTIRVDEVQLNDTPNTALFQHDTAAPACTDLGLHVDENTVPVTAMGSVAELLAGKSVKVTSCAPVALGQGWRLLRADDHAPFDQIELDTAELVRTTAVTRISTDPVATIADRSSSTVRVSLDNPHPGTILTFNQSYDKGWEATVNGRLIGPATNFNTMNGWILDDTGSLTIELRYRPERTYNYALVITAVGLALCVFLAIRRPRWRRAQDRARLLARNEAGHG